LKYLITGGCGFLGSNIASELIRQGIEPIIFDNLSRYGSSQNLEWLKSLGNCKFVHGDIRNYDDCIRLISNIRPDTIFHLAGQVAMTTSIERPYFDFETNALGSLNILEAVRLNCPSASIIYSSTNKVYGDLEDLHYIEKDTRYELVDFPFGLSESININFSSPYGCSKGCADQYMIDYARIYGLKTVVLRHSSMYGGRQFSSIDQGWIGWFCNQAIRQKKIRNNNIFTVSGNGKQVRDMLHSEDMIRLYLLIQKNIDLVKGEAFNIGGGKNNSLSILELLILLEKMTGNKLVWKHIDKRESDQKVFIADTRKIDSILKWSPLVNKVDGLIKMMEWVETL
jgi:CDP-paratose 2-epimerase